MSHTVYFLEVVARQGIGALKIFVTKWHAFLFFCTRAGYAVADFADFQTTLLLLPAHPCSPRRARVSVGVVCSEVHGNQSAKTSMPTFN